MATSPALADQLIDNVNGITLDGQGKPSYFSGLLIGDDGKVKRLLSGKDKLSKKERKALDIYYDATGKTMLPGFAAPSCNLVELGLADATVDLGGAGSLDQMVALVRDHAGRNPDKRWILGHGYDASLVGEGAALTGLLDDVAGNRPVWLIDRTGDMGWANSDALTAAGIVRDGGGVLTGKDLARMEAAISRPRPSEYDQALQQAQKQLLAQGITTAHQLHADIHDWQALRRAGDSGRLRVRTIVYAGSVDDMILIAGQEPTPWLYKDRLRAAGLSLQLDGSLLAGPASVDTAPRYGDAELRNIMSRAAMDRFQTLLVAHGERGVEDAVLAIEELGFTYKGERRWRIEGLEQIDAPRIALLASLGAHATLDPLPPAMETVRLGQLIAPGREASAWPARSLSDAGIPVSIGGRCGPGLAAPLASFAAAISRADAAGQPLGGWQGQERLTREGALAALTLNPARAVNGEDRIGLLLPGYQADFVLLDVDPMLAPPASLWRARVRETWVGGERYFLDGADSDANRPDTAAEAR